MHSSPPRFTVQEYESVGRKPASVAGWVCVSVLAALVVFMWAFAQWTDIVRARDFQAFESGLARVCAETHGVYVRGRCQAPAVAFQFSPLDAYPHDSGSVGLAPQLPAGQLPPM